MTKTDGKPPHKNGGMTWAQAFRDIVITSMNRGQLPVLGMIAVVLVLIWKMPDEASTKLVFSILDALQRGELVAYALLLLVIAGWFTHAKWMRKMFSDEARRIGREKSDLQSALTGDKFQSSDRRVRGKK